jgi:hypothetical protein
MSAAALAVGVGGAVAGSLVSSALAPGSSGTTAAAGAADPFASQRAQYQTQLSNLMSNPSSITSTPGYQFNMNQGMQQVQGSAAASGMLNSGNTLTALQQEGQGFAESQYNNQALLLAQLSGANVGSPGTAGQIMANQNTANTQAASVLGNQVGTALGNGVNSMFSGGYTAGSNPFATATPGISGGGNTYGFTGGGGGATSSMGSFGSAFGYGS